MPVKCFMTWILEASDAKLFTAVFFFKSSKLEFLPLSVTSTVVKYFGSRLEPTITVKSLKRLQSG